MNFFPTSSIIFSNNFASPLRVYLAVSADLYYIPHQSPLPPNPPKTLADFCGASRLFISRLPDNVSANQVDAAITSLSLASASQPPSTPYVLRVTCSERRHAPQRHIHIAFDMQADRDRCLQLLRFNIHPWALQRQLFVQAARAVAAMRAPPNPSEPSSSHFPSNPTMFPDKIGSAAQIALWGGAVAQGIAAAAGLADAAERSLGGVSLIGPILQLISLCTSCAATLVQAKNNRIVAANLRHRLLRSAERLVKVATVVLNSALADLDPDAMREFEEDLFSALIGSWDLLTTVERHMMDGLLRRAWNAEEIAEIEQQVTRVEDELKRQRLLETLCRIDGNMRDGFEALRMADRALRDDFAAELQQLRLETSAADDVYTASFATIPDLPSHVVREGIPNLVQLRAAVLDPTSTSVRAVVCGDGGVGKTAASIILSHDEDVQTKYPDGHYLISLGPSTTDADVTSALSFLVEISGGIRRSSQINRLVPGAEQVSRAVALTRDWFSGRRILFILDNVWPRVGPGASRLEWAPALSAIASAEGSAFLFSTRMPQLANFARTKAFFERLDVANPHGHAAAVALFEAYAGIPDLRNCGDERLAVDSSDYIAARDKIIAFCGGWQIAFVMAGPLVNQMGYDWDEVMECLEEHMLAPGGIASGTNRNDGLYAIMAGSLTYCDKIARIQPSGAMFNGTSLEALVARFGPNLFKGLYAALASFETPRSVEVPVLAVLVGIPERNAVALARLLDSMGLATLMRRTSNHTVLGSRVLSLSLHDLQFVFAKRLCGTDGLPSLKYQHRALVTAFARKIDEPVETESPGVNWSLLYQEHDTAWCKYIRHNLFNHLLGAVRDDNSSGQGEDRVDADTWWRSSVRSILTDYRWIEFRGKVDGRPNLLEDWTTVLFSDAGDRGSFGILSPGEWHAVETVYEVLQSVGSEEYKRIADCAAHGMRDRGLAGQLYGNLNVLEFRSLKEKDRTDALAFVTTMQKSINQYAYGLWLRPIGDCCGSVEKKDHRCRAVCTGGEGPICALVHCMREGMNLVASACQDGKVRLHDIDINGRVLLTLPGHNGPVLGVAVASEGYDGGDLMVASCSVDATVRIWHVRGSNDDIISSQQSVECRDVLNNESGEMLARIAITPDGRRIVAGGAGYRSGTKDSSLKYAVYVWTRVKVAAVGDDHADGQAVYQKCVLRGHSGVVCDVCISRDGSLVVSGSHDGTVRVWRFATSASPVSDELPVKVINARSPRDPLDKVWCISLRGDNSAIFAGTEHGRVLMWDASDWKTLVLAGGSNGSVTVAGVCSMAYVDLDEDHADVSERNASPRLLTGHVDGTIGEWCGTSLSRLTVYGNARSGAGHVWGLAGRGSFVGPTKRFVMDMVSGYGDGRLRSWDAGSNVEEHASWDAAHSSNQVTEGMHVSGDVITCACPSRDGLLLVSGSRSGRVSIWSCTSGELVGGFQSHTSAVFNIDVSSDSKLFASCCGDGAAKISRVDDGKCLHLFRSPTHETCCIIFSRGDTCVISGDTNGSLRVYDVITGECRLELQDEHSSSISALAIVSECADLTTQIPASNSTPPSEKRKAKRFLGFTRKKKLTSISASSTVKNTPPVLDEMFCSREKSGKCVVRRLKSGAVVEKLCDIPAERTLTEALKGSSVLSGEKQVRESICWYLLRPESIDFRVDVPSGAFARCIGVSRHEFINCQLHVALAGVDPHGECSCIASIMLDAACSPTSFFAFNRTTEEGSRLFLGCGLADGKVAFLEMRQGLIGT